ncbi:hypothetical protein BLL41_19180 [Bacillus sp. FMQ74]|nr:hypothetical protein BLL41_19180 [Bacillus sp. FMQ74]
MLSVCFPRFVGRTPKSDKEWVGIAQRKFKVNHQQTLDHVEDYTLNREFYKMGEKKWAEKFPKNLYIP